jgi:5-methylcytosine-specific restriction endonuclease McrA
MKITREFIEQHRTANGGFTFAQCKALGTSWPPEKGWLKRAVEIDHAEEAIRLFVEYKTRAKTKPERRAQRAERRKELKTIGSSSYVKQVTKKEKARELPPPKITASYAFIASKEFLESYEWRTVRMQAIKKYGPVCQCCGASPASGAVIHVDHIKPRKLFPQLALDVNNLQVLCHECNHGKGNWDMTDWRPDNTDQSDIVAETLRRI